MKIQPMPPLRSLVAFEAATRHLSFTEAAMELNVTQGAVSRQVKLLEDYLGSSLFKRTTRSIELTPTGGRFYDVIRNSLLEISNITSDIRRWQGLRQVTVMTSTAMASLWLLPKMAEFQSEYEEIDLRIIAYDQVKDFSKLDCDIALYYCKTLPNNIVATPLFAEEVFPVCSPSYLAKHPELTDIQYLPSCTWLWLEDSQLDWISWPEWLQLSGMPSLQPKNRININSYSMLIQSALNGQGVALAWSNLVDTYLQNNALVRPLCNELRTEAQFCLFEPRERGAARQSVQRFRSWLIDQLPTEHPTAPPLLPSTFK